MTPFLLLWTAVCGVTILSFWTYLSDATPESTDDKSFFWKFGRFYDEFFFNHGEPTAALPPPVK